MITLSLSCSILSIVNPDSSNILILSSTFSAFLTSLVLEVHDIVFEIFIGVMLSLSAILWGKLSGVLLGTAQIRSASL